jgi:hypothetical protein
MPDALAMAFKEWAAICRALADGRQSLILRKGGIAEDAGAFRLEATRFLLYPTFVHQQETELREDAKELLDAVQRERPTSGVRIEAWGEVTGIYQIRKLWPALLLAHLHFWSDETVEKRFHYRQPGLNVLAVRIYRLPTAVEIADDSDYQGCKSWVPLKQDVSIAGSTPVLSDQQYRDVGLQLDTLLRPTAIV